MRQAWFCFFVTVIFCTACLGQDDHLEYADLGFKIDQPSDQWSVRKSGTGKAHSSMVKVTLKGSSGAIEFTVIAEHVFEEGKPEQRCDESYDKTINQKQFENRSKKQIETAEGQAPGFQLDWTVADSTYRVQQCYLFNQLILYTIAIHAPVEQFNELEPELTTILKSFRFVELDKQQLLVRQLKRLAERCGDELDWETNWERAVQRAKSENKCILVLLQMQHGYDNNYAFKSVPLMDRHVIDLLNEYCIAIEYQKGMDAAINEYSSYGIGPNSFGNTALLVEPDGNVIGDTFIPNTDLFYDFLLRQLVPSRTETQPPKELNGVALASWHARRGHLERSLSLIDEVAEDLSLPALRLRASIFERQMKGPKALAALDQALAIATEDKIRAEIGMDRVRIQLASELVSAETASETFQSFHESYATHERAPEAAYWLGACQMMQSGNATIASKTWGSLIEDYSASPWAAKAAATLLGSSLRLGVGPQFAWPAPEVVESFRFQNNEKITSAKANRAKSDAIKYLLKTQLTDGSWISPPDALKSSVYATRHFTAAVTSICARALLPFRDDKNIHSAIDKAVNYLLIARKNRKSEYSRPVLMDYAPWGDSYSLIFVAEAVESNVVDIEKIRWLADDLVSSLSKTQKRGGGWNYFVSRSLEVTKPSNSCCSFMTATIAIALIRARDAGFDVPDNLTDEAISCLLETKRENLTHDYFLFHDAGRPAPSGMEGAAGRGPLCSLALMLGGKGNHAEIEKCLEMFIVHSPNYVRESGKSLMHAAPGSQGSHYLMFDYDWAAEALCVLPAETQKKYREKLIDIILTARSVQGAYLDNPINGWHYGTGMALHALNILSDKK